ncbi:ABC transporter permease subunit [bacterium]|nr:ABC transporter permease subunit [bacterium]NIN91443.1 ABC transporter permease subunit [bacterium]NIO17853.1 ABC transporter permease subunit [bacterium]NIO72834.1 ABC transporter permease subunit [bacterium]
MWKIFWKRFRRNKLAMLGAFIIFSLAVVAIIAPLIAPFSPDQQDILHRLEPPSGKHFLGTDDLGRDLLSRIVYGTRVSLLVGFVAIGIAIVIGSLLGLLSGYFGGWLDTVIMRFVDIMLCFPTFFLILMVIAFLEPSIWNVMAVIGLTGWPSLTRLVRGECLSVREREFVQAARALGLSNRRVMLVHLLPNVMAPILVTATLGIGGAILTESALSFLGLGVQPPTASWGNILTAGKDYISVAWWLSLFPGLAILITVLAYNLLGEGLRDVLDPRMMAE